MQFLFAFHAIAMSTEGGCNMQLLVQSTDDFLDVEEGYIDTRMKDIEVIVELLK